MNARERFIPTCVGNIDWKLLSSSRPPVHPHVCGEHEMSKANESALDGSSPRVWGTYRAHRRRCRFTRFIPTCVGNILPRLKIA